MNELPNDMNALKSIIRGLEVQIENGQKNWNDLSQNMAHEVSRRDREITRLLRKTRRQSAIITALLKASRVRT